MNTKKITSFALSLLLISTLFFAAPVDESVTQKKEEKELSPRYKAFLAETQLIMSPEEKEVFLGLATDGERDTFIEAFWNARRERGIRDNISTLRILRMTQVLDLTEDQVAKIFPAINRIEKEKREIQRDIGKALRSLRNLLREDNPDPKEIENQLTELKRLRDIVKSQDEELESFLDENLTLIQRAKYMLFSVDFYRGLREKLERARQKKERF